MKALLLHALLFVLIGIAFLPSTLVDAAFIRRGKLKQRPKAYIKLDGVDGESKDGLHKDWIDVLAWSWGERSSCHGESLDVRESDDGMTLATDLTGRGTVATGRIGEVTTGDVVVVKELDKSSVKLMESCANGKMFDGVVLDVASRRNDRVAGDETYLRYTLTNALVSSYHVNYTTDDAGVEKPVETIALNFIRFKVSYSSDDDYEHCDMDSDGFPDGFANGEVCFSSDGATSETGEDDDCDDLSDYDPDLSLPDDDSGGNPGRGPPGGTPPGQSPGGPPGQNKNRGQIPPVRRAIENEPQKRRLTGTTGGKSEQ